LGLWEEARLVQHWKVQHLKACQKTSRGALEFAGAETVDRAREMWWLGLRDAEKERYSADGSIFEHDEQDFRSGFEAALRLRNRNRSYEECYQELDGDARDNAAFRRGYERGRQYLETFRKHASAQGV
jgi:hypothetical protein